MSQTEEELRSALQNFVKASGEDRVEAAKRFKTLLNKSKKQGDSPDLADSGCPDDVEDCSELTSPCCNASISNVFGTLPLKVQCRNCDKTYLMGALIRESLKKEKSSKEV